MAFSFEVTGIDELIQKMNELEKNGQGVAAAGLYEGAGIIADKVSSAIDGIRTAPFRYAPKGSKRLPSPEEKALVKSAKHGVAKFRKNPTRVDTSVGYQNSGYGSLGNVTKPVPLIANAINSGTSFMQKQPFFRKAFSQSTGAAQAAIEAKIESEIDNMNIE